MNSHLRDVTLETDFGTASPLKQAVYRSSAVSKQGLLERLFAYVFDGLVYPQIWEDPLVDMAAMSIEPHHHVVAITSGGCNVLSYLAACPSHITAVDLNQSHLSLLKLKLAAIHHLPAYEDFSRFFAGKGSQVNVELYDQLLARHLDSEARAYWDGKRIRQFAGNFYCNGLLGHFITAAHLIARLYRVNPADIMKAKTLDEQHWFFAEKLSPLFDKSLCAGSPHRRCLYTALAFLRRSILSCQKDVTWPMCCATGSASWPVISRCRKTILPVRLLAAAIEPSDEPDVSLPPYLESQNWEKLRTLTDRVSLSIARLRTCSPKQPRQAWIGWCFWTRRTGCRMPSSMRCGLPSPDQPHRAPG